MERATTSAAVELHRVTKAFGPVTALHGISLTAVDGEFLSFLGPSGCGKTTLLRIIAGLEDPTSGDVSIRGRDVGRLPPYLRDIGMVFQQYALFPHKSVARNIEFGLRYRARLPSARRAEQVRQALELVRLRGFEARKPAQLSGGEQQRVALARALVTRPAVLLLDEPLSNLDAKLRAEMRLELKHIHRAVGITFVYVTHDREEALAMSDRVVVMRGGRIEQVGSPQEVYERPRSEHVARFMGHSNILDGVVERTAGALAEVRVADGEVVAARAPTGLENGERVGLVVRAEGVRVETAPGRDRTGGLRAKVETVVYQGSILNVSLRLPTGEPLWAELQNCEPSLLEPGREVALALASDATWTIRREMEDHQ